MIARRRLRFRGSCADGFGSVFTSPRRGCGRATSPSWVLVVRSDAPARGLFRTPGPCFRGGLPAAFAALARPPFQPHHPGFPGSSLPARERDVQRRRSRSRICASQIRRWRAAVLGNGAACFRRMPMAFGGRGAGGRGRLPEASRYRAPICATAEAALRRAWRLRHSRQANKSRTGPDPDRAPSEGRWSGI
jgi:hypothetical protein